MKLEDRKLWIERIQDYRNSGLTAIKWSEEKGISVHKLRYYINKFSKESKEILKNKIYHLKNDIMND
ncbi:IS66 family insertion sequence element accessory protein TnpA [Anaerosalibacter massiliensis]|uniref:Uncharacterized protein n=1 Tax=Anaerosalibacter massiliensis TaxID=1347392 RepID=A0A9X2MJE2_9FIRM|nr:hypothetical protein [Anaerosalibacter massiliensis]MCR2044814.1 hypothetical protein [Anaerosalibacter massiliensis]